MKLEHGKVYKRSEPTDILEEVEYSYWICIADTREYYILHDLHKYAENNSMKLDYIDDLDEHFNHCLTLDNRHFKIFNDLEAVYYKDKVIEDNVAVRKNKFTVT